MEFLTRYKETDRLKIIASEFRKFGVKQRYYLMKSPLFRQKN